MPSIFARTAAVTSSTTRITNPAPSSLADVTSARFAFDVKPLAELIHWGDIIDGAQYPTPESAVALAEPATKLALVIEAAPEEGLVSRIIPELSERPLEEMIQLPIIAKHLGPLLRKASPFD